MRFRGRAWVLGDNISTDHIISGKYKFKSIDSLEAMLPHIFEEVIPNFYKNVKPGDVIVAGRNFGMGSSREHAARLLKMSGISAVIAKSFARIFYRNAVNIAQTIPEVTKNGDVIEVDLSLGVVNNLSRGVIERFKPFPKELLAIIQEGGIINYIKRYGDLKW